VLLELIRRDEAQLAKEVSHFLDSRHDLRAVFEQIIARVLALESQWGGTLFRDVVGLYFSGTRPDEEQWVQHPTFVLLAAEIERARHRGELYEDVDCYDSAAFFLVGLHALLTSYRQSGPEREVLLGKFVKSTLRSLQPPAPR
jgi:hypothetical protein